jgi:hypothetical protein
MGFATGFLPSSPGGCQLFSGGGRASVELPMVSFQRTLMMILFFPNTRLVSVAPWPGGVNPLRGTTTMSIRLKK